MTRTPEQILCCPAGCIHTPDYCAAYGDGVEDLRRFHSMTTPDRLTLARALLPDGWAVARDVGEIGVVHPQHQYAVGWNACRAAILASSEEIP